MKEIKLKIENIITLLSPQNNERDEDISTNLEDLSAVNESRPPKPNRDCACIIF